MGPALQIHAAGTSAVEAAWHRRLGQQGAGVPGVLANADGELETVVPDGRAGHGSRACVLFEWVAGRSLRTRMTGRSAAALGRLSARLHQDAAAWSPGAGDVLAADRVRRWPDGDRLADAFRGGYGECRPWPDASPALLESLIAARALHTMNLTLNITGITGLDSYVADHAERIRAWMRCPAGP